MERPATGTMPLLGSIWSRLAAIIAIASLIAFWLVVCLAEQSLVALAGVTGLLCFMSVADRDWTLSWHVRRESIQNIVDDPYLLCIHDFWWWLKCSNLLFDASFLLASKKVYRWLLKLKVID